LVDIFIELGHLYEASASMNQRSKEFIEVTGWTYRLKWPQVEELLENKESSFRVKLDKEDFVSDYDATRPFSQNELNDLVCVHLKMVKLLLGQLSGFPKFPRCHGRWDAVMTDYCWTLKRDVPAANFSRSSKKCKFKLWMNLEQSRCKTNQFFQPSFEKSLSKNRNFVLTSNFRFLIFLYFFNWVSTKAWPDPQKWMSFLDSAWPNYSKSVEKP